MIVLIAQLSKGEDEKGKEGEISKSTGKKKKSEEKNVDKKLA